jgi:hypothetical protein
MKVVATAMLSGVRGVRKFACVCVETCVMLRALFQFADGCDRT